MSKLRHEPTARRLQLEGFDIVSAVIESLVGQDERPSPLVKQIAKMGKESKAQIELAQDGVLLGVEIMKIFREAALGKLQPWQVVGIITSTIFAAVPELQNDVETVKALEAIDKTAEADATGKESRAALDVIRRNMIRHSRP